VGAIFTALGLILLTLMVYLFSLTIPDPERHRAVYASLAKAFLFSERHTVEVTEQAPRRLLSGSRQALRVLSGFLALHPEAGRLDFEGSNLVLTLGDAPDPVTGGVHRGTVVTHVAQLAADLDRPVRVEAYPGVSGDAGSTVARAARVAADLARAGVSHLEAVGYGMPYPGDVHDAGERMRLVLMDAKGTL